MVTARMGWGGSGAAVAGILLLVGCSGSSDPEVPADCSSVADTTQAATVSYRNDIVPMFATERYNCTDSGCHAELPLPASDFLLATYEGMFEQGLEAKSLNVCSVKPGDPDKSYIIWKIEGRSGIQGVRMPQARPAMSAQDIQLFRQWIQEGARNN